MSTKCGNCPEKKFVRSTLEGRGYCQAGDLQHRSFLAHEQHDCWKDKPCPGPLVLSAPENK